MATEHQMTCGDAARLMVRRADGDALDERTSAALEAHLAICASCQAELDSQRNVVAILRSRPVDSLSLQFASQLAQRLDDVSGWFGIADWRAWTFRLSPLAAALALVAFLSSSQTTSTANVDLDKWMRAGASGSAISLIEPDVTTDTLLETMLSGESAPKEEGANVR